jgi:predicted ArsR family transcriptional regulator
MPGRPKDVPDEELLVAIKATFGPATAGDISDRVGLNRSGTNKRLDVLVDDGLVHEKTVGANAVVYWLTDEGKQTVQEEFID